MEININERYEIAYDFYGKIFETVEADSLNKRISIAIEQTIQTMSVLIEDSEGLKNYLLSRISREKEEDTVSVMLGEEAENSIWWDEYRTENTTKLKFWNRYSKYLFERKHWEKSAIAKSIGNPTDMLLNAIADPNRGDAQEKRAMVVGYVQSGKTANYIGLINKALDAGYKYIIVLAGIHNNLRSQTQSRIDEEVLGYETSSEARQKQRERAEKNRIGVGKLYNAGFVQTLTFRDESGDFSKKNSSWDTHPDVPTIIVTKKIKSTLTNLIENIESKQVIKKNDNGHLVMPAKYPLLLIDDEADQASVNTGYDYDDEGNIIDEYEVKTINRLIRKLLNHFECKSYVGYTATPYANIFIPNDLSVANEDLGNDLFPADCIIRLPKPYRYIGANEFFGYGTDDEESNPMPLVRIIEDEDFIDIKKKNVGDLPDSLKRAMKCFLISIAIRNCRGELYKPNTMLIHVARIKNMHKQLERKVSEYFFDELQSMIIDGDRETRDEFYGLIQEEYLPTSQKMRNDFSRYMEDSEDVDEDKIYEEIIRLMNEDKVKVSVINGDSKDVLSYKDHEGEEYNVIAIGGDKFSRGLTLEGLSISYFIRESKYYDTLMQMGRWFGFRPKYADLCRVFITDNIYRWFARIQIKLTVIREQSRTEEMVGFISKYANSQNKINMSDFSANDPYHIEMARLSEKIYVPSENGKSTLRWYYERARGQYMVDVNRQPTVAAKKKFKEVSPKSMCISKTVAAKCMMAWMRYPNIVSKGLETNFIEFSTMIKKGEVPAPSPDSYISMISKVILFKACDKLVAKQKFGGYKAQINYYVIALLAEFHSNEVDDMDIWKHQSISPELSIRLEELIIKVWNHFMNPEVVGINITQWCKKEECWKLLKKRYKNKLI